MASILLDLACLAAISLTVSVAVTVFLAIYLTFYVVNLSDLAVKKGLFVISLIVPGVKKAFLAARKSFLTARKIVVATFLTFARPEKV